MRHVTLTTPTWGIACSMMTANRLISCPHLGHVITDTLDDGPDITKRLRNFIGQVNDVLCFFGKVSCDVNARLFRAYCTSFYGCELWDLSGGSLSGFCTAWRKALRRIWNLPYRMHCHLLPLLCNCMPVFEEICKRSLKFLQTCVFHNTTLIIPAKAFARDYVITGVRLSVCLSVITMTK